MTFTLYLVTDRKIIARQLSLLTAVEEALKAGVRAVQLREKDLRVRELAEMAYKMREVTKRYQAQLFINDRVDIALCAEADGVHLGRSGIPVRAARKLIGKRMLIGASTHSEEEALAAEREGADFITFGPLYDTPSKRKYGEPVGTALLARVSGKTSIPVFGIGGVQTGSIREVIHSGARGIALIRGILGQADIRGAAERYMRILQQRHCREKGRGERS